MCPFALSPSLKLWGGFAPSLGIALRRRLLSNLQFPPRLNFFLGLPGPGIPFSMTRSSVIRSRTVSSTYSRYARAQCGLGTRLSKFATELMSGEWEWGISTGFSFQIEGVPRLSSSAYPGLMICDPDGIMTCFQHLSLFWRTPEIGERLGYGGIKANALNAILPLPTLQALLKLSYINRISPSTGSTSFHSLTDSSLGVK